MSRRSPVARSTPPPQRPERRIDFHQPVGGDADAALGLRRRNRSTGRKVIYFDFDKSEIKAEYATL